MALRLLLLSLLPGFIYPFGLPTPLTLVNKVPFMRQFTTEIQIDLPSIDASGVYDPSAKEVVEAASALPNPIVPVIFTLFLVGGVGALTGSLGDVVAEEVRLVYA